MLHIQMSLNAYWNYEMCVCVCVCVCVHARVFLCVCVFMCCNRPGSVVQILD